MAEKLYAVRLLDPAQAELEEIARLYLSLSAEINDYRGRGYIPYILKGLNESRGHSCIIIKRDLCYCSYFIIKSNFI